MSAAELNWFNRNSAPQQQKAGALGAVKFVSRETAGINEGNSFVRYLAERLHHVAVQESATFLTDFRDLAQRLNHARFVVRVHDRDEHGLILDRIGQLI